jgi:hypothetical protein
MYVQQWRGLVEGTLNYNFATGTIESVNNPTPHSGYSREEAAKIVGLTRKSLDDY